MPDTSRYDNLDVKIEKVIKEMQDFLETFPAPIDNTITKSAKDQAIEAMLKLERKFFDLAEQVDGAPERIDQVYDRLAEIYYGPFSSRTIEYERATVAQGGRRKTRKARKARKTRKTLLFRM